MVLNNNIPLTSNFRTYRSLSEYHNYIYPHLNFSQYVYPSLINLNAYPNTLSFFPNNAPQDLSYLAVDPATLSIIPDDIFENPKQTDNRLHKLNTTGAFSYHQPDEQEDTQYSRSGYMLGMNPVLAFTSDLFTSPQNYQYILPNGRTGTAAPVLAPLNIEYNTPAQNNKIIYDAKKAQSDAPVLDILGRVYDPDAQYNLTDSQDYVDESLRGQILDYYQYNTLDPTINTPQNRAYIDALYQNIAGNGSLQKPQNNVFISDALGSNTALKSPLSQNYNMPISTNTTSTNPIPLNSVFANPNTNPVNTMPINNVFSNPNNSVNPLLLTSPVQKKASGWPFNTSDYNDYTGTHVGEYYHILQFMQESMAEITKVKVPFVGVDGNPVPQNQASKELTGNVPVFDVLAESYGWMATSPYYQDYINRHVIQENGGVHDVITPRGYSPSNLLLGGISTQLSFDDNTPYQTPTFSPVTVTDPRLRM